MVNLRRERPTRENQRERSTMRFIALSVPAIATSALLAGGITYDESVDGDLSDDRFAPTSIALVEGVNSITMDVIISDQPGGDRDYFTFNIAAGLQVDSVFLVDASNPNGGFDSTALVAFTDGSFFDFDPDTFVGSLNGFVLTSNDLVGTDIFPELNSNSGSVPALAGDYTFWVQQTGSDLTSITLDIVITPSPMTVGPLAMAGLMAVRRRRSSSMSK